jgi:hypothetical protein
MKNKMIKLAVVAAASVALAQTVQAQVLITGSINFSGGTATFNSADTEITAFAGNPVVSSDAGTTPTGSYSTSLEGDQVTGGLIGTGGSLTFSPTLSPNPATVWSFEVGSGLNVVTYSFILQTVTSTLGAGGTVDLGGTGLLEISGGSTDFSNTEATWSFSTAGSSGDDTFGFIAGDAAVPDGGTTAMMLGAGLSGLALLKRKLVA